MGYSVGNVLGWTFCMGAAFVGAYGGIHSIPKTIPSILSMPGSNILKANLHSSRDSGHLRGLKHKLFGPHPPSPTYIPRADVEKGSSSVGPSAEVSEAKRRPAYESAAKLRREIFKTVDLWSSRVHATIRCIPGSRQDLDEDQISNIEQNARQTPRFHLSYMPMRNRIEIPRLILEASGTPYDLQVIGFKKWSDVKSTTPLGKTPVLHNFDGKGNDLSQECSITRYLARLLNLDGKTPTEQATVDMLYTQFYCTLRNNGLTHDGEHYSPTALRESDSNLSAIAPDYNQMWRVNNFSVACRSLAALRVFERQLEKQGTGYLVGDSLTYVDLALFNVLFELAEPENVPDFAQRFDLPLLGNLLETLGKEGTNIGEYVRSQRRMPRYSRPGYVYQGGNFANRPDE